MYFGVKLWLPMIPTADGFNTIDDVHTKRKAGMGPKASSKYGYSAPDLGIMVPSSAYVKEPKEIINNLRTKRYLEQAAKGFICYTASNWNKKRIDMRDKLSRKWLLQFP